MKKLIFSIFFLSLFINSACQVRDPVPLKPGDETNKFLDKRNQKGGGADSKLPDPTSVQHSLFALERQSQLAQLLVLAEKLSTNFEPANSCLKVQSTKSEASTFYFVDLNNCRFDYDQTSQSQSGRLIIETKKDFIRIQTLKEVDSLRLKTIVRKSGKLTTIKEDLLIEADKTLDDSSIRYNIKTFAMSSFVNNQNTELHTKALGFIQLTGSEKDLTLEAKFTNWNTNVNYQSDANNGFSWALNLSAKDQDSISENINVCGSRKASLRMSYSVKLDKVNDFAELTMKDNVIALEKEIKPIFIQAPDCAKSVKPEAGIFALPWGRVIL